MRDQSLIGFALRAMVRSVTIRIGKLFLVLLDGPSEGVYNALCIVMQSVASNSCVGKSFLGVLAPHNRVCP